MDGTAPGSSDARCDLDYVAIATVGKPVGLDGACRVFAHGKTLAAMELPCVVSLGTGQPQSTAILAQLKPEGKAFRARFAGYLSRERADDLKNLTLYVERGQLSAGDENEFYHFELEGMMVRDTESDRPLGKVVAAHDYPTIDAVEVERTDGRRLLLPLTEEAVQEIDRQGMIMRVRESVLDELL